MAITPDTNLKLLKCNLNLDEMNQINFASATAQYNYFNSLPKLEKSGFTYQRKDSVIRYPSNIDSIIEYNYVMYQNHNYTNKWFYAYIVRMEYVNDNMTNIYIKTDPYQTWQFDIQFKKSFVEREHVNNDTVGLHTVPENLETGEFISINAPTKINHYESGTYICVAATELIDTVTPTEDNLKRQYNGIYSGLYYMLCTTAEYATNLLRIYDSMGKADAVYSIFLVPKEFIYNESMITWFIGGYGADDTIRYMFALIKPNTNPVNMLRDEQLHEIEYKEVSLNNSLADNYTPRNKKLLTGQFNYMMLTNNAGGDVALFYEDFYNNTPRFKVIGAITPGCSIKCIPVNYKILDNTNDIDNSYNYGINSGKFPICSYMSDSYTNWLTQNGVNVALQVVGGALQITAGALITAGTSGAGAIVGGGSIASGSLQIANALGSVYEHSIVPAQAKGNINSGDVTYSAQNLVFTVYQMSVKKEYAQIIDEYFDMFGYKINHVKIPNITGRRNWNYVKTIDVNIEGYIPQEDLTEIKGMFNNGVTIWHNPSTFLDYSQNNDII